MAAPVHRCSHVGSWLRPAEVKEQRTAFFEKKIGADELRKTEDKHIAQVVKEQQAAGLKDISDDLDFLSQLGGITVVQNSLPGEDKANYKPPTLAVSGKLKHVKDIEVDNYKYLTSLIDSSKGEIVKIAIPSATMAHFRGGRSSIDIQAYPNLDDFFDDLALCYRQEIAALGAAGCKFVQLDDTNLAYLCDLKMREAAAGRGEDLNTLPRQYAKLINDCIREKPKDMTIGIHLCRGNFRSTHFAEGGYEPIAEVLFRELDADIYFLEFDDSRSGDFAPLRFLPEGKTVILGLVSSKFPELEDKQAVIKRIQEAAKIVPGGLKQLGLSPQCGFSSTAHGNNLTADEQWAKMKLCREIVEEVWGKDA
ncbi:hypothetical protein EMMF5_000369 [Cystobasidiomycetes sp. EMM_F5]